MTAFGADSRVAGWLLAGTVAAALLSGAAALALAGERLPPVVALDLGSMPPSDATIAAIATPAPQVADTPPHQPEPPAPDESAPVVSAMDSAPRHSSGRAVALPEPETPAVADVSLPEKPVKPKPRPDQERAKPTEAAEPGETSEEKPKRKKRESAKPGPQDVADAPAEDTTGASTAKAASKAKASGGMSPAAYAKAVMKKVQSTRKAPRGGKGTAVVGFSIGTDGGLAAVRLLQSSGDAALDKVALDHIRRAAPFPVPPPDAGRSYSFEFVGK